MKTKAAREKVVSAKTDLTAAEHQLETVLRTLRIAPRAEKTTVSKEIEAAFEKLRAAHRNLVELEKLLSEKD